MTMTVLLVLACPGLGLIAGYYCLTDRDFDWRSGAFCLALFLGALSYSYISTNDSDIVRYLANVERSGALPFAESMKQGYAGEGLWLMGIICWALGRIGDPHLLPMLSTFFTYFIGLYVAGRVGEDFDISRETIAIVMFMIWGGCSYYGISNNVRNIFCFSVESYAVFRETYLKKRDMKTLLLYILPMYIHSSSMVMIACRLLVIVIERFQVLGLVLSYSVGIIVNLAHEALKNVSSGNSAVYTLKRTVDKAYFYFNDTSSSWSYTVSKSGSNQAFKMCYIVMAFILCYFAYRGSNYLKKKIQEGRTDKNYQGLLFMVNYNFTIGMLVLATSTMYSPQYWRFAAAQMLFSAPVFYTMSMLLEEGSNDKVLDIICQILMKVSYVVALAVFALWVREMRQSDVIHLLTEPFVCGPFSLIIKTLFAKMSFYL